MFAALLLLGAVSWAPSVPAQFQSSLEAELFGKDWTNGTFVFDRHGKRTYWGGRLSEPYSPVSYANTSGSYITMDTFMLADSVFFIMQGQTRTSSSAKSVWDIFEWLPLAEHRQDTVIDGREVKEYRLLVPVVGDDLRYYCTNDDRHLPVRLWMNVSTVAYPGAPKQFGVSMFNFAADITTTIDPSIFAKLNKTEAFHPPTCPAPAVTNEIVDMYIFHPKDIYNISGQNTADAVGDTAFVCIDTLQGHTQADNYSVVSWYQVEMYPMYGQYQFCNGYAPSSCVGDEPLFVGREAAYGITLTDNAGQCSENPLTGTWYNLPATGECMGDAIPDGVTCAWKVHKLVKTVEGSCIVDTHSMLDVCKAEQHLPFPKSAEIFKKAFTEDDVAKGGCPALPRP